MLCRKKNIPWVEKYRPSSVENIVLSDENRSIFNNIINTGHFPNLILHGPPGTGKTTTIVNFIKEYQKQHNQESNELIIHLNASDDRGIDVIRSQINNFASSSNLFTRGTKIVILDEVDYMTETAQYALRSLIQITATYNVRYCLLCNYISRIVEVLCNEFICLKYDQLPKPDINTFLHHVAESENIILTEKIVNYLHLTYKSDIRSMINFIQLHNTNGNINDDKLITPTILSQICNNMLNKKIKVDDIVTEIDDLCSTYNIDVCTLLSFVLNNFIRHFPKQITNAFLSSVENIFQNDNNNIGDAQIIYFTKHLRS